MYSKIERCKAGNSATFSNKLVTKFCTKAKSAIKEEVIRVVLECKRYNLIAAEGINEQNNEQFTNEDTVCAWFSETDPSAKAYQKTKFTYKEDRRLKY